MEGVAARNDVRAQYPQDEARPTYMDGQRAMVRVPEVCFTYSVFVWMCVGYESVRGFYSYTYVGTE